MLNRGYDAVVGADLCFRGERGRRCTLAQVGVPGRPGGAHPDRRILAQEIRERDATPAGFLAARRRGVRTNVLSQARQVFWTFCTTSWRREAVAAARGAAGGPALLAGRGVGDAVRSRGRVDAASKDPGDPRVRCRRGRVPGVCDATSTCSEATTPRGGWDLRGLVLSSVQRLRARSTRAREGVCSRAPSRCRLERPSAGIEASPSWAALACRHRRCSPSA